MSTAIIYIRVSTDEQALTGYSMHSQEERIAKFCQARNITILQSVFEDHSAKSFHRPAWNKLMKELSQNRSARPDLLLFTRWDRFSRNTADAYYMISRLRKLDIETQAIDQPLDMKIPENKVLLAMYIVTAEVENERRSLNVKYGIYRAKQEGRWMGHAPIGYVNAIDAAGRKVIVPHEPMASLIKEVFENTEENCSVAQLYRKSVEKGLRCSLNGFWNMIRNPVYYGMIRIPAMEDRAACEVRGNHQGLISKEIFDQVQSRIRSRAKVRVSRKESDIMVLRGFLYCPNCLKRLTGSGAQGRSKKYYYYHCRCGYSTRADKTNEMFFEGIGNITAGKDYAKLYKKVVKSNLENKFQQQSFDQKNFIKILERTMDRAIKARELLVRGEIDNEDYLAIKLDCESQIQIIGNRLNESYSLASKQKHKVNKITKQLSQPSLLYDKAEIGDKKKLVSLFVKERLVFDYTSFGSNLNNAARTVYGMPVDASKYSAVGNEGTQFFFTHLPPEESMLNDEILNIEKRKGNPVSIGLSLKILHFLLDFAKISLK